jgi:hypothetical protein
MNETKDQEKTCHTCFRAIVEIEKKKEVEE